MTKIEVGGIISIPNAAVNSLSQIALNFLYLERQLRRQFRSLESCKFNSELVYYY